MASTAITVSTVGRLSVLLIAHAWMHMCATFPFIIIIKFSVAPPYFKVQALDWGNGRDKPILRRTLLVSYGSFSLFLSQISVLLNFRPSYVCKSDSPTCRSVIDFCSAQVITGLLTCFDTVPQTTTCTTPLGLYAQPLCENCHSEKGTGAVSWF